MDWTGKTVAVTGGAGGIGRAVVERFRNAGAKLAVCDLDQAAAIDAAGPGGFGAAANVGDPAELTAFIDQAEAQLGPLDGFVANAGVGVGDGPTWDAAGASDEGWDLCWRVNVMQSVWAARRLVPAMVERGGGTFVVVASAAGLLNMVGDAAYTATKHAAVSFAESLAITHGDQNLKVYCLCPEGVRTAMTEGLENSVLALSGFLEPPAVAEALFDAMQAGRFMVHSHPDTAGNVVFKSKDRDHWLAGMRKIRRQIVAAHGKPL